MDIKVNIHKEGEKGFFYIARFPGGIGMVTIHSDRIDQFYPTKKEAFRSAVNNVADTLYGIEDK